MTKVLSHISYGIRLSLSRMRLIGILYVIQLAIAMTVGLQVYQVLEASIGDSLALDRIAIGFDFTVFQDLIKVHGGSISPLLGQLRWYLISYLIFSVFIHAGLLHVVAADAQSWTGFWQGGAKYFRPFFFYALIFMCEAIIWSGLIWLPYFTRLFYMVEHWANEPAIIWLLGGLAILYFFGLSILFLVSINTRIYYMKGRSFWNALRGGFILSFSRFGSYLLLMLLFALLIASVYFVNFFFELNIGIRSEFLIIAFIVLQQLFVLTKLGLRIAVYSAFVQAHNAE